MGRKPREPEPDGAAELAADAELTGSGDSGWDDDPQEAWKGPCPSIPPASTWPAAWPMP